MAGRLPQANRCLYPAACKIYNFSTRCSFGHSGFLCADCIQGYYKNGHVCSVCPGKKDTITYVLITLALLVVVILIIVSLSVKNSNKNQLNRLLSSTKIGLNYFYLSSQMYSVMSFIDWPTEILTLINLMKWLELDPMALFSLTCWFDNFSLYDSYLFFICLNGSIASIAVIGSILFKLTDLFGIIRKEQTKMLRKSLIAGAFVSVFFIYPPTCFSIVQLLPFACKEYYLSIPNEHKVFYFMQDTGMKCFTGDHKQVLPFVYISIIYIVSIPIAIPTTIWYLQLKMSEQQIEAPVRTGNNNQESRPGHVKSDSSSGSNLDVEIKDQEDSSVTKDVYDGLQFYYGNYKKKFFFWESIEMVKKVFLTAVAVFVGERSRTSLALLIMFSGVFSVLHAQYKPIANKMEHYLQLLCLSAIFIHLITGLSMRIRSTHLVSDIEPDTNALTVVLIASTAVVVLLISGKWNYSIRMASGTSLLFLINQVSFYL